MTEFTSQKSKTKLIEPSALAGYYLRQFSRAIASMEDFQDFLDSLKRVVGEDPFLEAEAELKDPSGNEGTGEVVPDFNRLDQMETLVPVAGEAGQLGYLKLRGRRDSQPFGAGDIHLMGAIAGFISTLTLQAQKFRQSAQAEKVLKYLINQLPLGVVCFNREGERIVESRLAARTLGENGHEILLAMLQSENALDEGHLQGHFEVAGRLVYTEARQLKVAADLEVTAFVLYDMSPSREKFLTELELEAYRRHARGAPLTLAILKQEDRAGEGYRTLMAATKKSGLKDLRIRPLDAYATACLFIDRGLRSTRSTLASVLDGEYGALKLSLVPVEGPLDEGDAVDALIARAKESFLSAGKALMPKLLVLDPYPAVHQSLRLITGDVCLLHAVGRYDEAIREIRSGQYNGLFVDIDVLDDAEVCELMEETAREGEGFKVFFCSCQQAVIVRQRKGVGPGGIVLRKPFQTEEVFELVRDQFN